MELCVHGTRIADSAVFVSGQNLRWNNTFFTCRLSVRERLRRNLGWKSSSKLTKASQCPRVSYPELFVRTSSFLMRRCPMTTANMLPDVPQILKDIPNWVAWKLVTRKGEVTKPLFVVGSKFKKYASSTDSSTWTDFNTAVTHTEVNGVQGVGFVVGGQAVEKGLVGVDIDGCRNPETGEITEWADEIIQHLDSYTEVTPSKTGVRVWVIGKPIGDDKVFKL